MSCFLQGFLKIKTDLLCGLVLFVFFFRTGHWVRNSEELESGMSK